MEPSNYEKVQKASAEILESCEMIGQTIREVPIGWITRSSWYSTRTSRKRQSMKEDGMVLVCKSRKKQVKETRKNELKAKDREKVQF